MKAILCSIAVVTLLVASSCSEAPVAPDGSGNRITETTAGELLLAEIAIDGGTVQIWAGNLEWDLDQQGASFDVYLLNTGRAAVEAPALLAISKIDPTEVSFQNPDGETRHGLPYKTYDEEFGDDGLLTPGERSDGDRFEFNVGEHRSFAIAFILTSEGPGSISGIVFSDDDENGEQSAREPGIGGVDVALSYTRNGERVTIDTTTGSGGAYSFFNLLPGVYSISIDAPGAPTTPNPLFVTLLENEDGTVPHYDQAHFGVHIEEGTSVARFHLTADVLCVPPFGSADIPGSGGKVVVTELPTRVVISSIIEGLLPHHAYKVHLMNIYIPTGTRWEDRECNEDGSSYGPFVSYGILQTDSVGDGSLSIDLGVEDVIPAGTYQLSIWINDIEINRSVLVSDSFELRIEGPLSARVLAAVSCSGTFSGSPPFEYPGPASFALSTRATLIGSSASVMRWPAFNEKPSIQIATAYNNPGFAAIALALTDGLAHVTAVEGSLLHETDGWGSQPGGSCVASSEQELFSLEEVDFMGATIDAFHVILHRVQWREDVSSKSIDFFVTVVVEGSWN